jgi:hypothetical protein
MTLLSTLREFVLDSKSTRHQKQYALEPLLPLGVMKSVTSFPQNKGDTQQCPQHVKMPAFISTSSVRFGCHSSLHRFS